MGMVIDGRWIDDDAAYRNPEGGAFVRAESVFRDRITADGSSGYPAEPGRYHLFLAPSCPWAHRTQIWRRLKGLEGVISATLADLPRARSWAYSSGIGRDLDPVDGVFELHRAYVASESSYTGRVTVPTLFDRKEWRIVNNESSEIVRMLNTEFDGLGAAPLDLYPAELRGEIDRFNDLVYEAVNNGVYRAGFARSQDAYEEAYRKLFAALDHLEEVLDDRRYLCGERLTEADGGSTRPWSASTSSISATSNATGSASPTTATCRTICASSTSTPASPKSPISTASSAAITATRGRSTRRASSPSARRSIWPAPTTAPGSAPRRRRPFDPPPDLPPSRGEE